MHVKVVRGQSLDLYACDLVKGEKSGEDTVLHLIRAEKGDEPEETVFRKVAEIVMPRDGDTVYVENDSGRTIDTFRAGEDLPTGSRVMEIGGQGGDRDGGQGDEELSGGRTRMFRGLPRGVGPSGSGPLPNIKSESRPRGES